MICGNCFSETLDEYGICTACGHDNAKNREAYPMALSAGSILYGRYIIGKVLGQGGFGITYLAQDYQTKEKVAIKEFFPDTMATRTRHTTVSPFAGVRGENFEYGRTTFLDEAKTMAEFNGNPNIAGVRLYFEENGTAYFVMEFVKGVSLQEYIKTHGGRISWEEALRFIIPVLNALAQVHEKGIIHRDVTPDNIFITDSGAVKLLDFGAARYSLGNVSRSLDVILKHGFAPKEQYSRRGRQGPYTDIYSVGATLYFAITGVKPDDSIDRVEEDSMPYPSNLGAKLSRSQEKALMKALAVDAEDRYQSATEFSEALSANIAEKAVYYEGNGEAAGKKFSVPKWLIPVGTVAALALGLFIGYGVRTLGKSDAPAATERPTEVSLQDVTEPLQTEAKVTEIPTEVSMQNVTEPLQTESIFDKPNRMASVGTYNLFEDIFWGQTKYKREDVHTVSFVDSLHNAPADSWDVSADHDGSVLAWMDRNNLIVAANGIISLPKDCSYLFDFENVTKINFSNNINTSNVTDMSCMFWLCFSLTTLDLSNFDTSNVTDMSCMFGWCFSLTTLDLSNFDTSNVTDMSGMFEQCNSLNTLDLSNFDTSNVTDMSGMFNQCYSLNTLDLSNFDTTNVGRFYDSSNILSALDSLYAKNSGITGFECMFLSCSKLTNLICTDARILEAYNNK